MGKGENVCNTCGRPYGNCDIDFHNRVLNTRHPKTRFDFGQPILSSMSTAEVSVCPKMSEPMFLDGDWHVELAKIVPIKRRFS